MSNRFAHYRSFKVYTIFVVGYKAQASQLLLRRETESTKATTGFLVHKLKNVFL